MQKKGKNAKKGAKMQKKADGNMFLNNKKNVTQTDSL